MKVVTTILIAIFSINLSALDITVIGPNEGKVLVPDSIVVKDNSIDFTWTFHNTSTIDFDALTSVETSNNQQNHFNNHSYSSFSVYDLSGRLVYSSDNTEDNILSAISRKVSNSNQLYFIHTQTKNGSYMDKLALLEDGSAMINNTTTDFTLIQTLNSYDIKIYKAGYEVYELAYDPKNGDETTVTLQALFDDLYSEVTIKIKGIQQSGNVELKRDRHLSYENIVGVLDLNFTTGHSDERELEAECINYASPLGTESKGEKCYTEPTSTDNIADFCYAVCSDKNSVHTFEYNRVVASGLKDKENMVWIKRMTGRNIDANQIFNVDYEKYDLFVRDIEYTEDSEKFYAKITDRQKIKDAFGHSSWTIYQYSQDNLPPHDWNSYEKDYFRWQDVEILKGAVIEIIIYKR